MKDILINRMSRVELRESLRNELFKRHTLSFYRYFSIKDPVEFRNQLFRQWHALNCFGRIYVAHEGVNAQMSVPEHQLDKFLQDLHAMPQLAEVPVKYAIEDNGKSFYKLTIKVRPRIVADGLDDNSYNFSKVGKHLSALEFHQAIDEPGSIVIDMRNHYESEVGRFSKAWCPDADTFKDAIQLVLNQFMQQKDKKILLYCTGGIRCEKASSYLLHNGFSNVSQLYGGIVEYAQQIKKLNITSKFIGKNFVFDERLGESVDGQIISHCHQCGEPADAHTNCANNDCHLLFIQCSKCASKFEGCCSFDCQNILTLSVEERKKLRMSNQQKYADSKIYNKRVLPKLVDRDIEKKVIAQL
jgi:UPF0176 protein